MALDPVTGILELGKTVMDKIWPDAGDAEKAKVQVILTTFAAQAQIVQTEAASSHWLAANWRPILMLTFGALIVARFLGFAAPGITEAEYIKLWGILELGIGGYVVGRSVEKIAPSIASLLKK